MHEKKETMWQQAMYSTHRQHNLHMPSIYHYVFLKKYLIASVLYSRRYINSLLFKKIYETTRSKIIFGLHKRKNPESKAYYTTLTKEEKKSVLLCSQL